ncbi:hypothetical protein CVIRNUC_010475 [Coccomyxa viridis]|uniref:Replication protein A subunit n=1 Tax=Coccomyxa viridis TaxID=1274662 RepID=A0AAV1IM00_9CHLO|nr:hypothetical protein CVIRNUC_010475 [Coccomyxa viridis]
MPGIAAEPPGAMSHLPSLSTGSVRVIAGGEDVKPVVLQLIGIKNLQAGQGQDGKARHRFALSDGELWLTGVPATQIEHLVQDGILFTNVVLRLKEYIVNAVNNKKVLIILALEVLGQADLVGTPVEYDKVAPTMQHPNSAGAPQQYLNGQVNHGGPVRYGNAAEGGPAADAGPVPAMSGASGVYGVNPAQRGPYGGPQAAGGYGAPPQNQGTGGYGGGQGYGGQQGYGQSSKGPYGGPAGGAAPSGGGYGGYGGGGGNSSAAGGGGYGGYGGQGAYRGSGAIARNEAPPRIVPIASLNSYQNHWTIKARITQKSDIKRYSNARGEGKLFSFELLDAQGGEIRGCGFNQCVDKFEPIMQQGAVIMLSKASLKNKRPNSSFNNTRHDYEITLEPSSVVELCNDEEAGIAKIQYHLKKIAQLIDMFANEAVDVLGVVDTVADSALIQTRDGKDLWKRNVVIRDDSGSSVEITFWGGYAQDPGDALQEALNAGQHPILALKNAKIGDFNGRTLSTTSSTSVTLDPDIPEAGHLRQWYDNGGGAAGVTTLTSGSGGGGGKSDRRITLAMVKDEGLGTAGNTAFVQVAAWLSHIKTENIAYPACTLQYNGKQCSKKVQDSGGGQGDMQWYCERCAAYCQAEYRYMLSLQLEDHTGKEWVTAFQDEAKALVGRSADEMQALKDSGSPEFDDVLNAVKCKSYVFKLRISEDTWQDEQRIRINITRIDTMEFAKESTNLLELITKLTLNQPILQPPMQQQGRDYGDRQQGAAAGSFQGGYGGGGNQGYQGSHAAYREPKLETSPYSRNPAPGGAGSFGGQGGGVPYGGGGGPQYGGQQGGYGGNGAQQGGYGGNSNGGAPAYGAQQGTGGHANNAGGYFG